MSKSLTYFLHLMCFALSLKCQSLKDMRILRVLCEVLLLVLVFILVYICTVSTCLFPLGTVHGSHLLSLGVLVHLVTSCMMLARYWILKAHTIPNSSRICFMLRASDLCMSLIGFINFIRYTELRSNVVFRNSPYNWQSRISNWLKSTSVAMKSA